MTPALPLTTLFTHSTFNRFSRFYTSELTYLLCSHSFRSTRNFTFVHFPPEFFNIPRYFGYAYGATCTCPFCLPPSPKCVSFPTCRTFTEALFRMSVYLGCLGRTVDRVNLSQNFKRVFLKITFFKLTCTISQVPINRFIWDLVRIFFIYFSIASTMVGLKFLILLF